MKIADEVELVRRGTVRRLAAKMAQVQRTEIQELNTRRRRLALEPVDVAVPSASAETHSGS